MESRCRGGGGGVVVVIVVVGSRVLTVLNSKYSSILDWTGQQCCVEREIRDRVWEGRQKLGGRALICF